jgi:sodium-coupled neutral amino acid transporter 11
MYNINVFYIYLFLFQGLLAAIPLAFILPAVCYLKLEDGSIFSRQKIGSLGLAVFGVGATVVGIVSLIVQVNKLDCFSDFF